MTIFTRTCESICKTRDAARGSDARDAFTLIETLVAITIISLAILAPFGAMQQVVRATALSRDQVIASGLAQEGIEYVRFIRYTNWLNSQQSGDSYDPTDGIESGTKNCVSSGGTTNNCTIDIISNPYVGGSFEGVSRCSGSCGALYRTPAGVYTQRQSGNAATPYTRYFTVTKHVDYITVTVTVTWTNRGTHTISLTENMYDWL